MFELPEVVTLAKQVNTAMQGKMVSQGRQGNSPHKFVWYNRSHQEFEDLTSGKTIGSASARGRWLFIEMEPGYVLLLGECGGKMLYHQEGAQIPRKYHLYLQFEDATFFTVTTQMWGAMELYVKGQEHDREYIKDMRVTPVDPEFTLGYFEDLITELSGGKKRSAKSLLTQDQLIPGLGNAITQDILFKARLHPRYSIQEFSDKQVSVLYDAIISTIEEIIEKGGRYDEYDLFNRRGGYIRIMDKNALERPCPGCGGDVQKIQYLGGACYLCPVCQVL